MNSSDTKIFLFTLPQEIIITEQEQKLVCNIVVMPKFNPLSFISEGRIDDLANPLPAFADSAVAFDVFLVKGTDALPTFVNHDDKTYALVNPRLDDVNADRRGMFEKLKTFFAIKEDYGLAIKHAPIKKYLPEAYRRSYGLAGTSRGAVTDDSYFCALKEDHFKQPPDLTERDMVNWAQVMAFCLHQPELARQLGLLYKDVELLLPSANYFAGGGWVYVDFKDNGSEADYHLLLDKNRQRYAAWIPQVTESRPLFSPLVFPVEDGAAPLTFDDVFDDVERYSDGFARIVHASQAVTTDHLSEKPNGTAPVSDMGIRLAWDDEQVLDWYNRGFTSQSLIGANPAGIADAPLMVSKYRVDVADITNVEGIFEEQDPLHQSSGWKSQVSVVADNLGADGIELGRIDAELGVGVSPTKHGDDGDFWLPAYFTNWNGNSLCLPDTVAEKMNELDSFKKQMLEAEGKAAPPDSMYRQKEGDKLELKYGHRYAFRVRLSDISGGGPDPKAFSRNKGPHKIALHTFRRYVAPQPPALRLAEDKQSMQIERPRLNYPAILFTGEKTEDAITELLADRQQLIDKRADEDERFKKKWLREVSLPDPDATQVEIVVEIKSLDMDREDSYNAIQKKTPKEAFVFLYKTLRNFPAYQLNHQREDDFIDLALSYVDIAVINFNAPIDELGFGPGLHSEDGPLLLPTARDIRLSIRTFCPNDKPDYFGTDDARFSIASQQKLRQDPPQLEATPLLSDEAAEPLLSLFFQPHPIVSAQFRQHQKMQGKGNQADSDLLDLLASITGLLHKKESILGAENIRTQMGCSAAINHTISPDRSVVTFASRDDFYHKWINVLQVDLARDWTWDLLKPDSFILFREWKRQSDEAFGPKEDLGGIYLTKGINWQTLDSPDRSFTRLIFIDALDPKPAVGQFPEPLDVRYTLVPQFKKIDKDGVPTDIQFDEDIAIKQFTTLLPITTPPAQVPKIISVGIALSPDASEEELDSRRYAETANRSRYLWVEFDQPILDAKDMYFARVLAYAPDPMLAAVDDLLTGAVFSEGHLKKESDSKWQQHWKDYLLKEEIEPPINLDPEIVRIVRPGQPFDQSGLNAMQAMIPATAADNQPRHFLLPLPTGLYPDAEDLFGFFTYEFRVGHQQQDKWSMAQGRFGSPLRLTGVQHPAPPMLLSTIRDRDKVLVSTRHAQSFLNGRNLTPAIPRTDIYACLYAQVLQADGVHYRNVLIDRLPMLKPTFVKDAEKLAAYNKRKAASDDVTKPFLPPEPPVLFPGSPPYAVNFFNLSDVRKKLRFLGIDENASLSVLTIELMPRNDFHNTELRPFNLRFHFPPPPPQDLSLEQVRILRTSRLCPVMDSCAVEK